MPFTLTPHVEHIITIVWFWLMFAGLLLSAIPDTRIVAIEKAAPWAGHAIRVVKAAATMLVEVLRSGKNMVQNTPIHLPDEPKVGEAVAAVATVAGEAPKN